MTRYALTFLLLPLIAAPLALAACDSDADSGGEGQLSLTVYGESFVEDGIPADETDGWAVTFTRFLVHLDDVEAGLSADDAALSDARGVVYDLAQASAGAGHAVTSGAAPAGDYGAVSYGVTPATEASVAGNATEADLALMRDGGYALFVEGSATKGSETKSFAWGFTSSTRYAHCDPGVSLGDGGEATVELTIHADHLLYDDLVSEDPNVAFDLIASADADADGVVTEAELADLDIRTQAAYQVGNRTEITDLWAFMSAQSQTVGHINGEGHCDAE